MRHDEWVVVNAALNYYLAHLQQAEEGLGKAVALADIGWEIQDIDIKRAQLPLVKREIYEARAVFIELSIENRHHD